MVEELKTKITALVEKIFEGTLVMSSEQFQ